MPLTSRRRSWRSAIGRGQTAPVVAAATDAVGVSPRGSLLDGELIDAKKPAGTDALPGRDEGARRGQHPQAQGPRLRRRGQHRHGDCRSSRSRPIRSLADGDAAQRRVRRARPSAPGEGGGVRRRSRRASGSCSLTRPPIPPRPGMVEPFHFALQTAALGRGRSPPARLVTDGAGKPPKPSRPSR